MSIEFDLITADIEELFEPDGITIVHIAHFNDTEVKELLLKNPGGYTKRIEDKYKIVYNDIAEKITETKTKLEDIVSRASTVKKSAMDSEQREKEKNLWEEFDELIDELSLHYDTKRNELLDQIDEILGELYVDEDYQKAEAAHASYKIKLTRIKEIGLGCFSMAGSATRIAFADIGSIVSFVSQAKDLFIWCKNNFNRTADDLYDDYHELDEALNALQRSIDESRIRSNISRVEKAFNSYVKIRGKFSRDSIKNLMNIQQFTDQIDDIDSALDGLKTGHRIKPAHREKFVKLKNELRALNKSKDQVKAITKSLKEALGDTSENNIRKAKNTTVRKKQTELKRLETRRIAESGRKRGGKFKGFMSIFGNSLDHIENIVSTISQIADAGLYER
jgi:Skp family chaperone for outer membrane proteins